MMPNPPHCSDVVLEVARPGTQPRVVPVAQTPFLLGRGSETGNHLVLEDPRVSRNCAAILCDNGDFSIIDRGQRNGVFVNGIRVEQSHLHDGDVIKLGLDDSYRITFRVSSGTDTVESMLTRISSISAASESTGSGALTNLNLLLEATSLLHSTLPLDSALAAMLDHAISITRADRGLLLEPGELDSLKVRLARSADRRDLPHQKITPSQTALRKALQQRAPVITDDLSVAGHDLKMADSVLMQRLRAVVAIPLYAGSSSSSAELDNAAAAQLLGVIYLDSRGRAAFSTLDCQMLAALGSQAASILDNARLVERERERQRMEQELAICHQIQQGLLPQKLGDFPHLEVTGVQIPCQSVGGDYFDVFPLGERTAFLVADVCGKGLGAALLTTMLQGALSGMTLGVDPAKVLNHINRFLCEHSAVRRFVTLFFGILGPDGTLDFMRAGHPPPQLLRQGVVTELYTEGSLPIGIMQDAQVTSTRTRLEPGDTLVLYSDGIIEANDPEGELFGFGRLSEAVAGGTNQSVEELKNTVLNAVEKFSRGAEASDDLTLLIVRYRDPSGD
jgi:phosphoserine phosphatase RsbU/P